MFEDFINAVQNFTRNKVRTFLSLLGVIIGVASVIVIMSMGESSTLQIRETFGSSGLNIVNMSARALWGPGGRQASVTFNEAFRTNLFDNVSDIEKIWYKNSTNAATLTYEKTSTNASLSAVEPGYLEMYGLKLDDGDYFMISDEAGGLPKIILGSEIASLLFPSERAVGKKIVATIENVLFAFEVVGVLKEQTSGMESATTGVYIPRGFYTKKITPNPAASEVMVQATSAEKAAELVTTISNYCRELTGLANAVRVQSMQSFLDQMNEITDAMSTMLSAIAAISLLVGGIGIMNIMIVTVTERKQEIGIRKALGASPAAIRRQFLVESASISLMGGLLGIIAGVFISLAVEYVRSLSYIVSARACLVAFAFSVAVGIFFGLNPAARAAKLDPVAALTEN